MYKQAPIPDLSTRFEKKLSQDLPEKLPRHLVGELLRFAVADIFGMFCFGLGASWFLPLLAGVPGVIGVGPTSLAEAVAFLAGGAAVMWWAMGRLLRAVARLKADEGAEGDGPAPR